MNSDKRLPSLIMHTTQIMARILKLEKKVYKSGQMGPGVSLEHKKSTRKIQKLSFTYISPSIILPIDSVLTNGNLVF